MRQNEEVRTILTHWENSTYSRSSIVGQWENDDILINSVELLMKYIEYKTLIISLHHIQKSILGWLNF